MTEFSEIKDDIEFTMADAVAEDRSSIVTAVERAQATEDMNICGQQIQTEVTEQAEDIFLSAPIGAGDEVQRRAQRSEFARTWMSDVQQELYAEANPAGETFTGGAKAGLRKPVYINKAGDVHEFKGDLSVKEEVKIRGLRVLGATWTKYTNDTIRALENGVAIRDDNGDLLTNAQIVAATKEALKAEKEEKTITQKIEIVADTAAKLIEKGFEAVAEGELETEEFKRVLQHLRDIVDAGLGRI